MPTLSLAISSREAQAGAKDFAAAAAQAQQAAKGLDQSVRGVDQAATKAGPSLGQLERHLAGFVSVYALQRFLRSSIDEFANFETALNNIATTLDKVGMKLMPQFKAGIEDLALKYGESTDSLAKGLYEILSAAIDAKDGMYVLEEATKAARAGVTTTAVAVDAFTTILNSYNLKASETGRVSDIMYAAVLRGKMTFEELASQIGDVAAVAASSNLSLEELGAAMATMTRAGLSADIAVTALKAIVTTFLSPTKENTEAARQFGVELNTDTLAAEGLSGVVMRLTNASAAQVAAIFSNVRALTGMAALLKQTEGYQTDLKIATDSAGMAQEAFGKTSESVRVSLDKMRESWNKLKRDTVEPFAPAIKNLGEAFDWLAPRMGKASKAMNDAWTDAVPSLLLNTKIKLKEIEELVLSIHVAGDKWSLGSAYSGDVRWLKDLRQEIEALKKTSDEWDRQNDNGPFSDKAIQDMGITLKQWNDMSVVIDTSTRSLGDYQAMMDRILREGVTPKSAMEVKPPSPELIQSLGALNVAMEDVNKSIADFGKKDWEKKIEQMKAGASKLKGDELAQFNEQLQKLIEKYKELEQLDTDKSGLAKAKEEYDQETEALQQLRDEIEQLKVERSVIGMSNEEREKALALAKASADWEKKITATRNNEWKGLIEQRKEEEIAIAKARAEQERLNQEKQKEIELENRRISERANAQEMIEEIRLEREVLTMTDDERERAIRLYDMERVTKHLDAEESKKLIAEYDEEIKRLQKEQKGARILEATNRAVGDMINAPLEAALDGTRSFGDAMEEQMKEIGKNMLRALWQELVTAPLQQAIIGALKPMITSLGGLERGGAFPGPIRAFGNGEVVTQPSLFTMGGGVGQMSEKKPEAIMPLERDASGRLGVINAGGGQPNVTVNSPIKVVNVLDPGLLANYLATEEGERQLVNVVRKNRQALGD